MEELLSFWTSWFSLTRERLGSADQGGYGWSQSWSEACDGRWVASGSLSHAFQSMVVHKLQVPDLDRRWSLRKHLFSNCSFLDHSSCKLAWIEASFWFWKSSICSLNLRSAWHLPMALWYSNLREISSLSVLGMGLWFSSCAAAADAWLFHPLRLIEDVVIFG